MIEYGNATLENTKDKYIFWDIDGTLAPYRFRDHIHDPNGTNTGMSLEEIEDGVFFDRQPSLFMQRVLKSCQAKENIILGHCHAKKEIEDKHRWLEKHFPDIKRIYLLPDEVPKYTIMQQFCEENHVAAEEIVFVDDGLAILREAEDHGFRSYHISSFLDWEYQWKE